MTSKQKACLDFIIAYQTANGGVSPAFKEIAHELACAKSRVHALMQSLKVQGYIHYEPGKKRQIHVMCPPEDTPCPDFRYRGRSTIRLAEYLSSRFGIEESVLRQALLEMPA